MRTISFALIAIMLSSGVKLFAQNVNTFSVRQAVDYGLKNSVQVKNAMLDIDVQRQVNREFTSAAYPQVNGNVFMNYYPSIPVQTIPDFISPSVYGVLIDEDVRKANGDSIHQPSGPPASFAARFGSKLTAGFGVDVSQILFDGQVFIGLMAKKTALEFYSKSAEVTAEQIKTNIYKVYYQLVVGKKQMGSLDANIERFEKLLHDTKEIYKNGFAEKLDVDKVTVQLNNLKTEKAKVENQLMAGNAALKFLIGMPQKEQLILSDTLSDSELKANILDDTIRNYDDRKEMQLLTLGKKLNEFNIRRYKLSYLPTAVTMASFSKNAQRNKFDFFGKGDWYTTAFIGLKVSVPIFDGFVRDARIKKAKLELQKTNNNMEQLKQSIDNDVEQSQIKLRSALITMDNQKQNIELAEKVYRTTKLKYEQGLGSNQEIYNAQTELKVSQNNYYSSLYDAIIAKIDYLKATGKL